MNNVLRKQRVAELRFVPRPVGVLPSDALFVQGYIQGQGIVEAYRDSIGAAAVGQTDEQLYRSGYSTLKNPNVQKYMKSLMKKLEEMAVANALDLQLFLTNAIYTPLDQVDESHPLCQSKTVTVTTNKDGSTTEKTVLKIVSKIESAKLLIRMKGLDAPIKVSVDHIHRVGVMVVPMVSGVDEWERIAVNSQKALMEDAANI